MQMSQVRLIGALPLSHHPFQPQLVNSVPARHCSELELARNRPATVSGRGSPAVLNWLLLLKYSQMTQPTFCKQELALAALFRVKKLQSRLSSAGCAKVSKLKSESEKSTTKQTSRKSCSRLAACLLGFLRCFCLSLLVVPSVCSTAQASGNLVVLEVESSNVCQTGLDEPELQWKDDKKAALAPCAKIKHSFQRVARNCPEVQFLHLEVRSPRSFKCLLCALALHLMKK